MDAAPATAPARPPVGLPRRPAALARGRERADAAPRRASLDGVDGVDRASCSSAPGALLIAIEPLDLPGGGDLLRPRLGDPVAPGAPRGAPGGPDRQRAQRRAARRRGPRRRGGRARAARRPGRPRERDLLRRAGLALQRGELGAWLVGEQGAFLVRSRRAAGGLLVRAGGRDRPSFPAGDRVAHLLLALREDELGFAKVANLGFSGATLAGAPPASRRARGRRSTPPAARRARIVAASTTPARIGA